MAGWQLDTPVALFVFNRPDHARRVVEQIAAVEPPTLMVVADGPRADHPDDEERCARTRSVVEGAVDWDCDLRRNYADRNLGLRRRFGSGLEWLFTREEEAIILEDDCVPSASFFRFCEEMLGEYRDDERIMDVTGSNHLGQWKADRQDYHFSYYGSIWGWATWRRSWEWYDPEMALWDDPEIRRRIGDVIADDDQFRYLRHLYQRTYEGDIDTWDYQWGFARHRNSALSVVPSRNLVSNIGFDERATHTRRETSDLADAPRYELEFPVRRNEFTAVDREYDRRFHAMRPVSDRNRLLRRGKDVFRRITGALSDR